MTDPLPLIFFAILLVFAAIFLLAYLDGKRRMKVHHRSPAGAALPKGLPPQHIGLTDTARLAEALLKGS